MDRIRIVQIFQGMDLRAGEYSLSDFLASSTLYRKHKMKPGEVFVFINRKRNVVKIMAARGILTERLPDKQTWDFKLRRDQLLRLVGQAFGINWSMSSRVYVDGCKQNIPR